MQPDADALTIEQKRELLRRRAGMGASSAGIGADVANAAESPIPTEMQTNPNIPSGGGAAGSPSDGTMARVKSEKGEAQKLTDALVWRWKKLTERGE